MAKKSEFEVGDWCAYFEIDSFMSADERFEFPRASSYKNGDLLGEGFRLKTQRFRGQVSQSLTYFVKMPARFRSAFLTARRPGILYFY